MGPRCPDCAGRPERGHANEERFESRMQHILGMEIYPNWDDYLPLCQERCPSHDGKRCEVIGCRPGNICGPAVSKVISTLEKGE